MSETTDVLRAIDQLRRDLSGYHGQLKAHNDLRRHCDNQRERIAQLEGLYAEVKAENAKLRNLVELAALVLDALEYTTSWRFTGDGMTFDSAYFNAKLRDLETEVEQ